LPNARGFPRPTGRRVRENVNLLQSLLEAAVNDCQHRIAVKHEQSDEHLVCSLAEVLQLSP
jgi:hypothetical protein